ncbi:MULTISPECIES: serine/threonine-protein kinase [unclassified Nostoc]|uniref:serine/threonine-protein kinase n=1 Tax=unclassified Nostoc TaxID=2593658 RepID=UPI00300748C3
MSKLGGRYQILEQIGQGGFGVTFLAEDTQRPGNPKCVVKQFQPIFTNPDTLQSAKRFFNSEAVILEKLGNHDQIPRLLAHFEEDQEFYLVQEYIEGHDLSKELLPGKKLNEAYVIKLLQDILQVLTFIHHQRVIHRDIKPSNIIRRLDGKIVLIDFGAVKQISTQIIQPQGQNNITFAVGTPGYMPSEQTSGNPDFRSDIYAVGIVAIQALTGISPEQLPKDVNNEIVWHNQAEISQELTYILDRMVRYDFRQRYESAEQVLQALQQVSLSTQQISPNSTFPPTILPQPIRRPLPWKWIISLFAVTATITVFSIFRPVPPPIPPVELSSYEDPTSKIKIKYPETWNRQDLNNIFTGELVKFSPKQSTTKTSQEQVTITIQDVSGTTLEDSKNKFIEDIKNSQNGQIISSNPTTLAYGQAYQVIYNVKDGDNNLKNWRIWTLKGDKTYIIVYTAAIDDYDKFVQTTEKMIQSFQID